MPTPGSDDVLDAIVVGGGPAGLAAALWLGRYRRATLVVDGGGQRNLPAHESHGYLTRDACSPAEFIAVARDEALSYESVEEVRGEAHEARKDGELFAIEVNGETRRAHRVLLATGVQDVMPDIDGFSELYGAAIFHCSCCDGYEARDREVVAIGWGDHAAGYAIDLLEWGAEVTLLTDGTRFEGDRASRVALERNGIEIIEDKIESLERDAATLTGVRLSSGRVVGASLAFFSIAHRPRTTLARSLGCDIDDPGYVVVDDHGATSIPGVYAAGDVTPGEQLVQVAASEGAVAGIACAMSLRGTRSASGAPAPGPDPEGELDAAASDTKV